jgi:glycosyltransferase involved in cell wall biosynthesis
MKLRVLHVLTSNARRGAQISALLIRDELRSRGHQAEAVALADEQDEGALDVRTLATRRLSPRGLAELRKCASRADVVIAHGSTTLAACAIALSSRVPFVYANIGDLRYWATTPARRARVRLLLRRAAGVAARSAQSAATLAEDFGVQPDRIRVVPNGRPAAAFPQVTAESRTQARARWGVPAEGQVVAWIGALSPEKRPDLAIEAAARVPAITLLMAGDGPMRSALEQQAAKLPPGRVHLLGAVPGAASVLAAADAHLLTSDSEGLPGVVIEAGLSGLASVSTRVGFVDDLVVDGVTGRLVAPGDARELASALEEVLGDAEAMGQAAHDRCVSEFSIQAIGDRWEQLLVDAATSRNGSLQSVERSAR